MSLSPPPPPTTTISSNENSQSINLDKMISPTILIIIVILSIIFFISGLLHLVIRLILRPTRGEREAEELVDHATVLQGQLQQLFHLHDSGVDQSYIDTLPVFYYKSIIGLKDPFDCAVCLCEFDFNDRLRLLPKCSHAFHMDCIDTWLLSHSTCPLCRSSLLDDFGGNNNHGCSPPIVCVLESGSVENSREIGGDRERISASGSNRVMGFQNEIDFGSGRVRFTRKSYDDKEQEEKIVIVKLGKFKSVEVGEGTSECETTTSSTNKNNINENVSGGNDDLGSRRCYSMGSFAYVLDEATSLQVPIRNTPIRKQSSKKPSLPLKQGHRVAMSEYGCDSQREFNGIDAFKAMDNLHLIENGISNSNGNGNGNSNRNFRSKRTESFSISKIWGRSKRTNSEIEIEVSELEGDEETRSCYSVDSLTNPPTISSTRRTLLWLMGRQNKSVHKHSNSLSSNV